MGEILVRDQYAPAAMTVQDPNFFDCAGHQVLAADGAGDVAWLVKWRNSIGRIFQFRRKVERVAVAARQVVAAFDRSDRGSTVLAVHHFTSHRRARGLRLHLRILARATKVPQKKPIVWIVGARGR